VICDVHNHESLITIRDINIKEEGLVANQGSARQNRAGDQSVSIQRSRSGRDMSRWDTGGYGPFAWMRQMRINWIRRSRACGAAAVEIKEGTSEQKSNQQNPKT